MDGTKLPEIPALTLQDGVEKEQVDAERISTDWLTRLERRFSEKSFSDLSDLFIDSCWWRDIVGLSWISLANKGRKISASTWPQQNMASRIYWRSEAVVTRLWRDDLDPNWVHIQDPAWRGKGLLKLGNVGKDEWKAWTVFTQLEKLNFQKEVEAQRAASIPPSIPPVTNGMDGNFNVDAEEDLQVLIVGAAQSGLMLGARLQHMGIKTRLVERSARLGDSWRERYQSVTLHTPTYADHWAFMKIPETWPGS
ncbi:flavin-binding monooxygenase [Colletotrichum tofieldiae]|nr:flavin-binding monooxygenase [Colletotrichum tofieldiae]